MARLDRAIQSRRHRLWLLWMAHIKWAMTECRKKPRSACALRGLVLSGPEPGRGLLKVVAVGVHHLGPGGNEVLHELLPGIRLGIDLGQRPQLRVAAEDQVGAGRRPRLRACLAIGAVID